jgi:hypothetical protein
MASGLHAPLGMENEKSLLDDEDAIELPERDALSVIDPGRMGGAFIPTVAPAEPTVDEVPETSTPS